MVLQRQKYSEELAKFFRGGGMGLKMKMKINQKNKKIKFLEDTFKKSFPHNKLKSHLLKRRLLLRRRPISISRWPSFINNSFVFLFYLIMKFIYRKFPGKFCWHFVHIFNKINIDSCPFVCVCVRICITCVCFKFLLHLCSRLSMCVPAFISL